MKFVFDQIVSKPTRVSNYSAESKPRKDIMKIMVEDGCVPMSVYKRINIRKMTALNIIRYYFLMALKIKKDDTLYYQFPIMRSCMPYFILLLSVLKKKGVKIVSIVHDLEYMRNKSDFVYKARILNCIRYADLVIVHTPAMKEHLESEGFNNEIRVLYLFDYLTSDKRIDPMYARTHRNEIVFAGNLGKAPFLRELNDYNFRKISFNLYGLNADVDFHEGLYKGVFHPEEVSTLKGGWGLVWDGDSMDTCSGLPGNYLRYNAPHKLSLYIASGIPVIVWKESGLANWIINNHLGIAIKSIKELDDILPQINEDTYCAIQENVRIYSELLRKGEMILRVINK